MRNQVFGYHGRLLDINLSTGKYSSTTIPSDDTEKFLGGRGLGMKILWDRLRQPGINPLSPQNPLMFMPGPYSGFPIPAASRTCVVTKSPCTSPVHSDYPYASTVSYSNIGGFFGPEIRFAGYDGIVITGKASSPVYIVIEDEKVEIRDAKKFWGMGTDLFDRQFIEELGDRRFQTCCIGPAGENLVSYACIIHTASRAAGRGVGCVMGSKNLKAITLKGSKMPNVADHKQFLSLLEDSRKGIKEVLHSPGFSLLNYFIIKGTASYLSWSSENDQMTVNNFRDTTFPDIGKIGLEAVQKDIWFRESACYCCPVACKKGGAVKKGVYAGVVHDAPEYETGTMFGANLRVSDIEGITKVIFEGDDYGMDIISAGNVIGFLMEAYEKEYIDKAFLDGIDLRWGDVNAARKMVAKIGKREGIGDLAGKGVKAISKKIGRNSDKFAIQVKGLELAAWNVYKNIGMGISYATSNRGACHQNGENVEVQNFRAMLDSLGICRFITYHSNSDVPGSGKNGLGSLLSAITGIEWTTEKLTEAGERIFNLEKLFNYREGFRREDDTLPERFFTEPVKSGPLKGKMLKKEEFDKLLDEYYQVRGWNPKTSEPGKPRLQKLGLLPT